MESEKSERYSPEGIPNGMRSVSPENISARLYAYAKAHSIEDSSVLDQLVIKEEVGLTEERILKIIASAPSKPYSSETTQRSEDTYHPSLFAHTNRNKLPN
ncbi:MAG: hypothetical protein KC506_01550 [Nanoarchaeota archaeon]|nr:hypothetical protein [Nanoarchaeota archaeon]